MKKWTRVAWLWFIRLWDRAWRLAMGRKKKDNKPGQKAGNKHQQSPKSAPNPPPLASPPRPPETGDDGEAGGGGGSPDNRNDSHEDTPQESAEKISRIDKIVLANLFLAAATAFAAIIQAFGGCSQLNEMGKQTKLSSDAIGQTDKTLELMQQDQRAWLSVGTPTMNSFPEEDGMIELTTKLRNLGKSHAFVRYADLHAEAARPKADITEEAVLGDIKTKAAVYSFTARALAPGEEMEVSLTILPSAMDELVDAMKGELKDSKKWVYIFGRIAYDDPLGEGITKAFCFVYVNDIKTAMPWPLKKSKANQE